MTWEAGDGLSRGGLSARRGSEPGSALSLTAERVWGQTAPEWVRHAFRLCPASGLFLLFEPQPLMWGHEQPLPSRKSQGRHELRPANSQLRPPHWTCSARGAGGSQDGQTHSCKGLRFIPLFKGPIATCQQPRLDPSPSRGAAAWQTGPSCGARGTGNWLPSASPGAHLGPPWSLPPPEGSGALTHASPRLTCPQVTTWWLPLGCQTTLEALSWHSPGSRDPASARSNGVVLLLEGHQSSPGHVSTLHGGGCA